MILRFSDWVIKKYPEEGLKIFIEDIAEVENLPRPKVLDYLLKTNEELVIPYLVRTAFLFIYSLHSAVSFTFFLLS